MIIGWEGRGQDWRHEYKFVVHFCALVVVVPKKWKLYCKYDRRVILCKHFLVIHFKEQFDAQLFALVVQKYPLNHALCSIAQKVKVYCKCHRWPILRILPFTELRYPGVYFLTMEIWCMKKFGKYTPLRLPHPLWQLIKATTMLEATRSLLTLGHS